jgi:hypothetical protein
MTIKTDRVLLRQFARWVRHDRAVTDIDADNKRRQTAFLRGQGAGQS